MADQKNHSFIFSSNKYLKFVISFVLFISPILLIYGSIEYALSNYVNFPEKIKIKYLKENKSAIEVLVLGASHSQRAINPQYLSFKTINLANSSQGVYENLILFQNFEKELTGLKLVIIGITYNTLSIDKEFTQPVLNALNLKFYKVNTFKRDVKYSDFLIYHVKPDYFTEKLLEIVDKSEKEEFNKYGFQTNKFHGNYKWFPEDTGKITDEDIYVYNEYSKSVYTENLKYLKDIIKRCEERNINVLLYDPPSHIRFNKLRKQKLIIKRTKLIEDLEREFSNVRSFIRDTAKAYDSHYFYNADHLNPIGAKKATLELNNYIKETYSF